MLTDVENNGTQETRGVYIGSGLREDKNLCPMCIGCIMIV
jgi:hypothetical protein